VIVVGGEALIDLVARDGVLRAFPGGGPFNTATALGRLGVPVAFLGRLSADRFGRTLEERLTGSGVDCRYVLHGSAPTPLAVVHMDGDGEPDYSFYLCDTAYAALEPDDLPELGPDVAALHLGTLALATDPPARALEALIERESPRRLIVLDPNVRPAVFGEASAYRRRFERWAALAHVVKLSEADAAWLYPDTQAGDVAQRLLACGARLAVLTLGARGAAAFVAGRRVEVPAPRVEVVDTVGAGDAFAAGLLCRLWEGNRLRPSALAALAEDDLADALRFATAVGSLQCSRAGAVPPTREDVAAFLRGCTP
jgi:fructokinase